MKIKVALEKTVQTDESHYDYKVFRVSSEKNSTLIFNHGDVFYNLSHRDPFNTPEECFLNFFKGAK